MERGVKRSRKRDGSQIFSIFCRYYREKSIAGGSRKYCPAQNRKPAAVWRGCNGDCIGDEKADLEVCEECKKHHIWVNVASDEALCDFRFPALVEEDDIVAGINSCNNDHGKVREVSAKIREILGTVDYNNVEE